MSTQEPTMETNNANNEHTRPPQQITAWPTGQKTEARTCLTAHRTVFGIVRDSRDRGHACAIGPSANAFNHAEYARVAGVPLQVAFLIDAIHEGLPSELALDWPIRVVEALAQGANTTHVWNHFVVWLLREVCPSDLGQRVAVVYESLLAGDEPGWEVTNAVPTTAEEEAAKQAAWAAWERSEESAALVAIRASEAALASAATEVAQRTAEEECYVRMADKLIEILAACRPRLDEHDADADADESEIVLILELDHDYDGDQLCGCACCEQACPDDCARHTYTSRSTDEHRPGGVWIAASVFRGVVSWRAYRYESAANKHPGLADVVRMAREGVVTHNWRRSDGAELTYSESGELVPVAESEREHDLWIAEVERRLERGESVVPLCTA